MNGEKINKMKSILSILFCGLARRHRVIPACRSGSAGRRYKSVRHTIPTHFGLGVYPASSGTTIAHAVQGSLISSMLLILATLLISCSTEPEPLQYGTDICHFCKMTLMDKKFGAELVTKKGKIYKFDDLNCFLNFYNSGNEPEENFKHKLVVDFSAPAKLIDATNAFYIKSSEIRSPMDGRVAAFETKASMDKFKKEWNGIYLAWGEVVTQYKK
jgi:copper chaperone NosL